MATTYEAIATVTLTTSAASISFTSIPQTYTDLKIVGSIRTSSGNVFDNIIIRPNNDSALTYSWRRLTGDGSSASSNNASSQSYVDLAYINGGGATSNTFGNFELYFPNYTGNTNKSMSIDAITENNATTAYATFIAGLWANTSAITSIVLPSAGSNFVQYSTATLYGIKNS